MYCQDRVRILLDFGDKSQVGKADDMRESYVVTYGRLVPTAGGDRLDDSHHNVPVHPLLEGFGIVNSVLVGVQQVC
jgi:hypothetical protein